ncbi:uncharacterized protein FMAN_09480 [Fusarium mangiferae]|uniref:Uncharacterized protein n=1 Tax=Fusarium mangiferae TaxID=192010 RepID=A0A1L7T7U8_FUSMA|nr:uncharacterized protein FMAN_09480 [Fusarium mangiferae]CVK91337.1 uncharacterized protein FMAN_09480 [Fusarium mangiferae]
MASRPPTPNTEPTGPVYASGKCDCGYTNMNSATSCQRKKKDGKLCGLSLPGRDQNHGQGGLAAGPVASSGPVVSTDASTADFNNGLDTGFATLVVVVVVILVAGFVAGSATDEAAT